MNDALSKWETSMQNDQALNSRLQRLNPKGYPATKKGDLLSFNIKGLPQPVVVNWNGDRISVERKKSKSPFLSWNLDEKKFKEIFLSKKKDYPPVLVAMNNDQKNIKAQADHHNGALVVSFMIMLQECMKGGGK